LIVKYIIIRKVINMIGIIREQIKGLRYFVGLLAILAMLLFPASALAATTQGVTISATPTFISIALNTSTYNFSMVAAGVDEDTASGLFGVTDTSMVIVNTTIQCNATWTGGAGWTWGAAAEDTGKIAASNGTGAFDVDIAATSTEYELNTGDAAGADFVFELRLVAPTAFTYGDAQTCQLKLTAAAA